MTPHSLSTMIIIYLPQKSRFSHAAQSEYDTYFISNRNKLKKRLDENHASSIISVLPSSRELLDLNLPTILTNNVKRRRTEGDVETKYRRREIFTKEANFTITNTLDRQFLLLVE